MWWNERTRCTAACPARSPRWTPAAPAPDAYSVHTNACDVATFREALAASHADVAFVVTTVPRKGRGRHKGKTYFAAHLDTTLAQTPTLPVIYVRGDDASSDQAERIIGAAHGVGDGDSRGATGDGRPDHLRRAAAVAEESGGRPEEARQPEVVREGELALVVVRALRALRRRGCGKGCVQSKRRMDPAPARDWVYSRLKAADPHHCGVRVGFIEDDVVLAENVMSVLGDLPVEPPDDVLGVSLWDADDKPLWHRCFNCYSKAIVYQWEDARTLGTHVRENFWANPVDWLVDDFGRDHLRRYNRCLVPNGGHIGT